MSDFHKFDGDPEALSWARAKVQRRIDHYRGFEARARETGRDGELWRKIARSLERDFIGGEGCVIASFDERLPSLVEQMAQPQSGGSDE